jgi:hypothetical protein
VGRQGERGAGAANCRSRLEVSALFSFLRTRNGAIQTHKRTPVLPLSLSTTTMGASQQLHQAANKIHKVERLTHAIQHPVQHGSNSIRWRIRRAIHGVVDRFLRCCCCGAL